MASIFGERGTPSQRAVVYVSSVPTDMRPNEVRAVFAKYGEIFRQKFVPKPTLPGRREAAVQFKEGWLEFVSKESATTAVDRLNASPVACRRTRRCYGQNWTCQVLPGFTWDDLVHEREGQRREEQQRRHDAVQKERGINERFRRMVEEARRRREAQQLHASRRQSKELAPDDGAGGEDSVTPKERKASAKRHRSEAPRERSSRDGEAAAANTPEQPQRPRARAKRMANAPVAVAVESVAARPAKRRAEKTSSEMTTTEVRPKKRARRE